jgi:hypothetical protein
MPVVIVIIAAVWGVLFGAAYLSRVTAGCGKRWSAAIVTGSYLALAALSLSWFGFNTDGILGAFGMSLPYAAAIGVVLIAPGPSAERNQ